MKQLTIYQLSPKIYYINEKGEKWYIRGQSISYEPYEFNAKSPCGH